MSPLAVQCPNCGKPVTWDDANPFRPFCSERCQLIDLGDWAAERRRVPGDTDYTALPDEETDGES